MFKIALIRFWHEDQSQEYNLSNHSFIYGKNTKGKTAFTVLIDYVLGSSEELIYQGLDNIDRVEALLTNEKTSLWIKRDTVVGKFYYKRTQESDYTEVSEEVYKDNISLIFYENRNNKYLEVYSSAYNEDPKFRSFNFLNFLEEKGLGDLSTVFTKAKEFKHNIRIRKIMDFFFNYENISKITEKEKILEEKSKELESYALNVKEYDLSVQQQKKLFEELQLEYKGDYSSDYQTFLNFKNSYVRNAKATSKDLVYLSRSSFELSEEIKLYNFMKNQSGRMIDRKARISRLLSVLKDITCENPDYEAYTKFIEQTVETLNRDNIILSLTDYNKAIKNIEKEKTKIDDQIAAIKGLATELSYEEAVKKVGLLEHIFTIIKETVDIEKYECLTKEVKNLKDEIKDLRGAYDHKKVDNFNRRLTELYLQNDLSMEHLREDRSYKNFFLNFDPFRVCLSAKKTEDNKTVDFMPASMTRQTHIQMLVYLTMFEYLMQNFAGFIYMPLLVVDSANQPMGNETFEKFYPFFVELADKIGIQTIFMSKDRIDGIEKEDFIDISSGLNKFHKA